VIAVNGQAFAEIEAVRLLALDTRVELQLHRWLRSISSRYHRYLPILVDALELDRVPAPLTAVLG